MTDAVPQDAIASIGARVRRYRQLRGWTQVELAERSGLGQQTISSIETGARGLAMSLETAWRLAWTLGCSVDALAGMPALRG